MLPKSTVKYIQSLQQKKFRDECGVFVAEGPKVVEELLDDCSFPCRDVYATEDWTPDQSDTQCPVTIINQIDLEKISGLVTPNKVVAVFSMKKGIPFSPAGKLTLLLDDIRDPGNLGTIIRTADWFGVENIVCSPDCAEMYNPKVVQSTMASLGRVNILYHDPLAWLENNKGPRIIAAALDGTPLNDITAGEEEIIIIGNESNGIRKELLQMADRRISIPGKGKAESLNAAVAAGIIVHHFFR